MLSFKTLFVFSFFFGVTDRMCFVIVVLPGHSLRKHAYSKVLRILPPYIENFQMNNSGSFHISAQNKDLDTC